jgi:MYXO-CTERM domain-containing protein
MFASALIATGLAARSASADNILLWTGGQSHQGISNAQSVLTSLGHTVTLSATVPNDLSPYDSLWAMDYYNGPDAPDEKAMVATFLNSQRGVYAQFEWDCCTNSQVQWTSTLSPLLKDPFLIQGSQGVQQNAIAEPNEVFGLTTTPHAIPQLQINATANIVTIPQANVVYRLNNVPVVGAYVDPQFVSGKGCIVLSGDIEEVFAAPQAHDWIENAEYFLQHCVPNPTPICGDGFLAMSETCDDGNTMNGDGCSSTCQVEPNWQCVNDVSKTPVSSCKLVCVDGAPCTAGVGACMTSGTLSCQGGQALCSAVPGQPSAEVCDGVDNDCNGTVDNGFNLGTPCSVGVGACKNSGNIVCDGNGGATCSVVAGQPSTEICDGVDNDCNGTVDDGFNVGAPCSEGLGSCKVNGTILCTDGGAAQCSAMALCGDSDNDGLSDVDEQILGTNPLDSDSDDDGIPDGQEPNPGADSDKDGIPNILDPDSDNDGIFDGTELGYGCGDPGTNLAQKHCVPDADNGATKTNPQDPDTDHGGVKDGAEDFNHDGAIEPGEGDPNNPADDQNVVDSDGDGISDGAEQGAGSNPLDADSDDDGVIDGLEVDPYADSDGDGLINMLDEDSDNDGLFDGTEMGKNCELADTDPKAKHCIADGDNGATKTNPIVADTDKGGVKDGAEDFNHNGVLDPGEIDPTLGHGADDKNVMDSDGDGLSDGEEMALGSDPNNPDSDQDGVKDGDEVNPTADEDGDGLIDVLDPDSDNDGLMDGTEMGLGCADGLKNCVPDADNGATKTNPILADTDHGSVKDGAEDKNKNGAIDPGETDPNNPTDDVCTQNVDCANPDKVCDPSNQKCVDSKCDANQMCPLPDVCHEVGVCDAASGNCNYGNKPAGSPCTDNNSCTTDSCQAGACVSLNVLDGTPCTEKGASGLCIAGHCLTDGTSMTGSGSGAGGAGTGGNAAGGNASGGSAAGGSDAGGTGTGTGGSAGNGNGNNDTFSLQGGGCTTSSSSTSGEAGLAMLALGLLFARRRRGKAA